ncbi:hypothetical protein MPF19_09605 [Polaribacter sp. Z014]|uniref:hypothetical protein n=1 Tax=Polaribacter sp. Z014 TaxID=2927126 RepID=UPI002021ADB0|nr:hypothetical protein [Polaribacter sp. Z014]MCL7763668.1 hypothetical protein [Polaribacter sp. Z014]
MNDNIKINFSLKGYTSILIGAYFFISNHFIKTILDSTIIEESPLAKTSPESIKTIVISILFLVFLLSSFTLFFFGKRNAKKLQHQLWNAKTKAAFKKYILGIIIITTILIILMNLGFINYLTSTFLVLYGVFLFLFKNKESKDLLVLASLCILLGVLCFLIPSYWSSAISIIAIVHVTYGFIAK